jgi:hypothetical protein
LDLRLLTALFLVHVPATSEPLHWRNRYLIARSPVANKLGRLMDTLLKGQRPDDPHDHG